MQFLKLNGWTIPVQINTPARQYEEIGGERGRAFDGTPLSTRQRVALTVSFTTTHLTALEARALAGILLGEGRYWPFDTDLWDVKGMPFESGSADLTSDAVFGGAIIVTDDLKANVGIQPPWTILVWRGVANEGGDGFLSPWQTAEFGPASSIGWAHYAIRSDGSKWHNGTRNDAANTSWIQLENGVLTLVAEQPGSGNNAFDDLVILPYLAPEGLIRGVYGLGRPYPRLPRIDVEGLATDSRVLVCEGEVTDNPYRVWGINAEHHCDGQRISGRIFEV